jgi:hypothetical protein
MEIKISGSAKEIAEFLRKIETQLQAQDPVEAVATTLNCIAHSGKQI